MANLKRAAALTLSAAMFLQPMTGQRGDMEKHHERYP